MAFRHSSLFSAVSSSIPRSSISSSMHLLQLFFGLPTGLLPGTSIFIALLTALSSPLLFTWPNHLNLFLLNLLSMSSRSHLLSPSSLGTLSCHLTPAMYLNILLSVVLIISRNPTVKGHVSERYNRTGLMHASYTLARCLKGTPRLTKRLDISFHFNQDAEILPLTATSTPLSHSSSSPRYLKVSTSSSLPSSNSMLLSSLSGTPWPLHLGHTKSLTPVTLRSPEHLLWHHLLHVLHSIEFAPTPLPQHQHGNLPLRSSCWRFLPETITFVLSMFIFSPLLSIPLFHLTNISFASSLVSPVNTRSSA